jgi:hypothetical protein
MNINVDGVFERAMSVKTGGILHRPYTDFDEIAGRIMAV